MVHRNNEDSLPSEERITLPDPMEAVTVTDRRTEVMKLFSLGEREVIERICRLDRIDPSYLNRRRASSLGDTLSFAEYYCKLNHATYVFFDKSCKHPIPADKHHGEVRPHNVTVLLRVKKIGIPSVMHVWKDQE